MVFASTTPALGLLMQCLLVVSAVKIQASLGSRRDSVWCDNYGQCVLSFQTVEVQRDVVLPSGQEVVCFGTVTASSCEGRCLSYSHSSIHSPTGFLKECTCCREIRMTSHTVFLSPCFDPKDGGIIAGVESREDIQQPSGCDCQPCTI